MVDTGKSRKHLPHKRSLRKPRRRRHTSPIHVYYAVGWRWPDKLFKHCCYKGRRLAYM